MPTSPVPFIENGMQPLLAIEVARQIDDRNTASPDYLMALGAPGPLAVELCRQIVSNETNLRNLSSGVGMSTGLAQAIIDAIDALPLFNVTTNGVPPINVFAVTTKLQAMVRIPFMPGGDADRFVPSFDNWMIGAAGALVLPDQELEIIGFACEQDSPALTVPGTFDGALGRTLTIGEAQVRGDTIWPSQFGLTEFSQDTQYWWRICYRVAAAGDLPTGVTVTIDGMPGAKSYYYVPANHIDQVYGTGALTAPSGASSDDVAYGPTMTLGRYHTPALSTGGCGDSVMQGTGDTAGWPQTGKGYFSRAGLSGGVGAIAATKFCHGGASAAKMALNTLMMDYFQYLNVLVIFLGENDIGLNGTGNVTTLYNNLNILCQAARAADVQKIVIFKMWPRVTSSNDFIDAAGQTYNTGYGPGEKSEQINALLSSLPVDYVFDTDSARDALDFLKWITNGTPFYPTEDGTHPTSDIYAAIGAELRTLLETIPVT